MRVRLEGNDARHISRLLDSKESLVGETLDKFGITRSEASRRCRFVQLEGGYEEFQIDGVPVLLFTPVRMETVLLELGGICAHFAQDAFVLRGESCQNN